MRRAAEPPLPVAPPGGAAAPRVVVVECECQVPGPVDGEPQFRTLPYCVARAADPGSVCRRAPPAALRPACVARRIWEPTRCPEGIRQVTAARPAPR